MTTDTVRVGSFYIEFGIIHDDREVALAMLAGMVVLRAEAHSERCATHYVAYCDDFDEVPTGVEAPTYEAEFATEPVPLGGVGKIRQVFKRWVRSEPLP